MPYIALKNPSAKLIRIIGAPIETRRYNATDEYGTGWQCQECLFDLPGDWERLPLTLAPLTNNMPVASSQASNQLIVVMHAGHAYEATTITDEICQECGKSAAVCDCH